MIRDLQRIQIKIGSNAPATFNLDPFLEIFARWRKEKEHPAEWVDFADYAHMPRGPGIVLVGQRCNLALDLTDPGPGILYAAKKGLTGYHLERMASAFQWCLELAKRLTEEKEFPGDLRLRWDLLQIRFNDRLETPNDASTDRELRAPLSQLLDILFGPQGYELSVESDPAQCYGFSIAAKKAEPPDVLLNRMAKATTY